MKNLGIKKLVEEINKLNKDSCLTATDVCFYTVITDPVICFYSKPDIDKLRLPESYYVAKGKIRNKHNTEDGIYEEYAFCYLVYPKA